MSEEDKVIHVSDLFPPMIRVMVEWVEAISGMSGEIDRETAQTLTDSISELSDCLRRLVQRPTPACT
jgi:hypothetical protein